RSFRSCGVIVGMSSAPAAEALWQELYQPVPGRTIRTARCGTPGKGARSCGVQRTRGPKLVRGVPRGLAAAALVAAFVCLGSAGSAGAAVVQQISLDPLTGGAQHATEVEPDAD